MKHLYELKRHFPIHVAFNLALLLKNVRPVVQIDFQDAGEEVARTYALKFRRLFPEVRAYHHSEGILLFFEESRKSRDVRSALRQIVRADVGFDVRRLVGRVLELVCPPRDADRVHSYRVLLGVADIHGNDWYFKQQMCARADSLRKVYGELDRYQKTADEMGMVATVMHVVRGHPKLK